MLVTVYAAHELNRLGLDCNKSYFLFCGSFGDKWLVASFMYEMLSRLPNSMIISDKADISLPRIFVGDQLPRVLTCEANLVEYLRNLCREDQACYMPCNSQLSSEGSILCTPGLRSLHIVDYPYFIHLSARCCARYIDMLRLICFLPINTVPSQPLHLGETELSDAIELLSSTGENINKLIIYNIVNYSHKNLTTNQQRVLIESIFQSGFQPIINISGLDASPIKDIKGAFESIAAISISGHLVKSVFDLVPAVIGVIGGAISIADTFSDCSLLTFATNSNFFPGYSSSLKRNINFLEYEDFKAEPRPDKPRIVRYINLPDHEDIPPATIKSHVDDFLNQISLL